VVAVAANDSYDVRIAKPKCAAAIAVPASTEGGGCSTPKLNEPVAVAVGVLRWRLCAFAGDGEQPGAAPPLSIRSILECNEMGVGCFCSTDSASGVTSCGMNYAEALDTLQQGVAPASCYPQTPPDGDSTTPGGCDAGVLSGGCPRALYNASGPVYRVKDPLGLHRAAHIQAEIEQSGPVAVRFAAPANLSAAYRAGEVLDAKEPRNTAEGDWDDFSGVAIGWGSGGGSGGGEDYWVLAMPFGAAFGDNGTLLHLRGTDLNGIGGRARGASCRQGQQQQQ
jgi:hypothetical protein